MKLYYFTMDNGDGSASVNWVTEENVQAVRDKSESGEDGWWFADESLDHITLPDGLTPADIGVTYLWTPDED